MYIAAPRKVLIKEKILIVVLFIFIGFLMAGCSESNEEDMPNNVGDVTYPDSPNEQATEEPPSLDDILRINQIQCRGTHNSYHMQGPLGGLPFMQYTQKPLDVQLDMGIRQFELDIHFNNGKGLTVYHVPIFDAHTTCYYFTECLTTMKEWSDRNPGHGVLFIFIEPKDDYDLDKLIGHQLEVEEEILSVWPRERIFTPDDLIDNDAYDSILDAIMDKGWPFMGEVRNQVMFFVFDSGPFRDEYVADNPTLDGRLMFVRGGLSDPFSGFVKMDDPVEEFDAIQDAVEAGYLVRTRADENCIEAYSNDVTRQEDALSSGAQMISTDFTQPPNYSNYYFDSPLNIPFWCNPLISPDDCSSNDIPHVD